MPLPFSERLRQIQQHQRSVLCVGLDPDVRRMPPHLVEDRPLADAVIDFNCAIIEATSASACAFKLNFAFFEVLGPDGWRVLEATIRAVRAQPGEPAPAQRGPLVIADAKRGDIGNSARFYAEAVFDRLDCDACTVAPYMGRDAVAPFLSYEGKAAFVLARTSNPSSMDFQEVLCDGEPLAHRVARHVATWNDELPGTAGLVVGATEPDVLAEIRRACPHLPFLIPGVGAQGGDPSAVMAAACTDEGLVLVNSSRQILYASSGEDFAEAAAREAAALKGRLNGGNEAKREREKGGKTEK